MQNSFEYTDYHALKKYLVSLADEPYRQMQKRLVPGEKKIIGVRVPKIRALAKQLAACDWRKFLADAKDDSCEEAMLQGFVIGCAKMDIAEVLERLAKFVPKIKSWAVCDTCCSGFKFTLKNRAAVFEFLQPYLKNKNEFSVRFAVIMLMDFFITDEYIDTILEIYDTIHNGGYYVKMAVAWALSVCYVKYPEQTAAYFMSNNLDDWTYNKALQKITESYRVSDEIKNEIRKMKRHKK